MNDLYYNMVECVRNNLKLFTEMALKIIAKYYKCTKYTVIDFMFNSMNKKEIIFFINIEINTNRSRNEDFKKIYISSNIEKPIILKDYRENIEENITDEFNENFNSEMINIVKIIENLNKIISPLWYKRFNKPPTFISTYFGGIKAHHKINTELLPWIKQYCSNPSLYYQFNSSRIDTWSVKLNGNDNNSNYIEWNIYIENNSDIISYYVSSESTTWGRKDPNPKETKKICKKLVDYFRWKGQLKIY